MHDQTLHFINKGLTAIEVAEAVKFPPALEENGIYEVTTVRLTMMLKRFINFILGGMTEILLTFIRYLQKMLRKIR